MKLARKSVPFIIAVALLAACLLAFFYMRICIEGIEYRGEAVRTDYSFGR